MINQDLLEASQEPHLAQQIWQNLNSFMTVGSPPTSEPHDSPWLTVIEATATTLLLLVVAVSAINLLRACWYSNRPGTVQLPITPTSARNDTLPTRKEVLAETLLDNLDHTLGDDGEPMNVAAFWRSVSHIFLRRDERRSYRRYACPRASSVLACWSTFFFGSHQFCPA